MPKRRKRKPAGRRPGGQRVTERSGPRRTETVRGRAATGRRRSLLVRAAVLVVAAAVVYLLFIRARGPGEISAGTLATAEASGCDELEQPVVPDPSRTHLATGEAFDYPDPPAAAGPHDASPLPPEPHVYEPPIPETRAVHNLEHAYVLVYYRPTSEDGLRPDVVQELEALARDQDRVIMAPYANLPDGRALALLAWNTRWMCPATISADQALTIARAFVDAFRGTTIAPEAPRGLLGPLLQP